MKINFSDAGCQTTSSRKKFGLCDDPPPKSSPAYIDELDGAKWIAVVVNDERHEVTFTSIDNCIPITKPDGRRAKRCDGVLMHGSSVIFIELKARASGSDWVKEGEKQLRETICHFEQEEETSQYSKKKAYVANSERPKFRASQTRRMEQFFNDTGYILRIENRIVLE